MKYYEDFLAMGSFKYADAVKLIGNESSAKSILQQYCKKGYIAQVKKGLYVAVNIVDKEPLLNKFEIASALTDTSFVACRSAFEYYGYANQVSYEISVMSEQKFNSFDFNGYSYFRIAPTIKSGVVVQSDGVRVSDMERTVVDGIKFSPSHIGFEELLNCLSMTAALSEEKLITYLDEYGKKFLYQKAGFVLEHFKNQLLLSDGFFEICKDRAGKSSRYLLKNLARNEMSFSGKWHLVYPANLWLGLGEGGNEYADI